jgi:hypothetical protein
VCQILRENAADFACASSTACDNSGTNRSPSPFGRPLAFDQVFLVSVLHDQVYAHVFRNRLSHDVPTRPSEEID